MEKTTRKNNEVCFFLLILFFFEKNFFFRNLSRTTNDTLICNEYIQFQLNKNDLALTSLRFLLFSIDRSGIQDLMFETLIYLNLSMIPNYQQIIQFNNLPQV